MKAELPIVVRPSLSTNDSREVHSLKIVSGSLTSPEGILTSLRLEHPLNNAVPRFRAVSGILMLFSDEASLKHSYPIVVMLSGRETETSLLDPKKTPCPNVLTPSGILTDVNVLMSVKKL